MGRAFVCFRYCLVAGAILLGVSSLRIYESSRNLFLSSRFTIEMGRVHEERNRRSYRSDKLILPSQLCHCVSDRDPLDVLCAIIVINRAAVAVRRSRVQCRWWGFVRERRQSVSQFACGGSDAGGICVRAWPVFGAK